MASPICQKHVTPHGFSWDLIQEDIEQAITDGVALEACKASLGRSEEILHGVAGALMDPSDDPL